jgi:hypothetical protein
MHNNCFPVPPAQCSQRQQASRQTPQKHPTKAGAAQPQLSAESGGRGELERQLGAWQGLCIYPGQTDRAGWPPIAPT